MEALVWHARIVWVAGDAHFNFLGNRDDTLEKVLDVLPHPVAGTGSHLAKPRIDRRLLVIEGAAHGSAAAPGGGGARNAEKSEVVFQGRNTGLGGVADHGLDLGDFAVPGGA